VSHGFVHDIDPIIGTIGGVHLWWYGAFYAAGFLFFHAWLLLRRNRTGLSIGEAYTLSLLFAGGVLAGGRLVEVLFYEWDYYAAHPHHIPALWLGGMSTHGLLLGAAVGGGIFCVVRGRSFLEMADELAVPGAFVMGMGRLANFIDGQIVGSVSGVWWAVKFPDAEGFRHPVVLYDGLKNLVLIPLLLFVRRRRPARGLVFANFVLWYGLLRFFIDFLREYPARLLGLPPGQWFNLSMSLLGLALIARCRRSAGHDSGRLALPVTLRLPESTGQLWVKRICYALLLAFCLVIPSDWTQDIPERYGKRHPGLEHSALYPPLTHH
jgi:phosphatidylglycerol:prolipoprotein diacylglycerol transferase